MFFGTIKVKIILAALVFLPLAFAAEDKPDSESVFDDQTWLLLAGEPSVYLQNARGSFLLGDIRDTALSIRKAAAFLKLESDRAKKETRKGLRESANELEDLAKEVENRSVSSGLRIEDIFSRAEYALADHYHQLARDYEASGQFEKAASAVEAAASHLLFASFWAEEKLEEADIIQVKEARSNMNGIKSKESFRRNKLGEAIKGIGRGLKKLGKRIRPFDLPDEDLI